MTESYLPLYFHLIPFSPFLTVPPILLVFHFLKYIQFIPISGTLQAASSAQTLLPLVPQ